MNTLKIRIHRHNGINKQHISIDSSTTFCGTVVPVIAETSDVEALDVREGYRWCSICARRYREWLKEREAGSGN